MTARRSLVRRSAAGLLLGMASCAAATEAPAAAATPVASAPAPAGHSAIPFKRDKQNNNTLAFQSVAGVVLAGLAAYGIVLGLKRFGLQYRTPLRKTRRLQTLESMRLGRRSMLYVIAYQGRELLLAESEHGIQLLSAEAPAAPPTGAEHA